MIKEKSYCGRCQWTLEIYTVSNDLTMLILFDGNSSYLVGIIVRRSEGFG